MSTAIERRAIVTLRGIPSDERLLRFANRHARELANWSSTSCRVALQEIRRLGTEPMVEATVSVGTRGTPLWFLVEDADPYYDVAAACDRVRSHAMPGPAQGLRSGAIVARPGGGSCI